MKICSTENVAGEEIAEVLGMVRGNTIRARGVGHDIIAGIKNLIGGEISDYTKMMSDSRDEAVERMVSEAENLGADGIVSVRFTTSSTMGSAAEILVYGTAVKFK